MKLLDDIIDMILKVALCLLAILAIIAIILVLFEVRDEKETENTVRIERLSIAKDKIELPEIVYDESEIETIAKTVWGEARGSTKTKQAAVVWCILNRVDDGRFPSNITGVVLQENQFSGDSKNNPVDDEIVLLVKDVMTRWMFEETAVGNVGRVLPREYCWFAGNGKENIFRDAYKEPYTIWDWNLESPYKED